MIYHGAIRELRMDVIHTAIWVSDLEEARSFFVDTLGLRELRSHSSNGVENIFVGGDHGAIQLRTEAGREVPREARSRMDHIAVSVSGIDEKCEELEAASCELLREPTTIEGLGVRIAFVAGPDSYAVELVEQLE